MKNQAEPSTTVPGRRRVSRTLLFFCLILLGAGTLSRLLFVSSTSEGMIAYKGKPLEAWFYGSKRDFFDEGTRRAAQDAIDGLGTNAFPFLLSKLKEKRGNGAIYFKLYRAMPPQVQSKMPYPMSGDDIKAVALGHIQRMHSIPKEQVQTLADCVPTFSNPRLRMLGYYVMLTKHQTDPAFLKLCRKLLNDAHPGIQLKAAINLAQSAIVSDPHEPRLFPILLAAMESKGQRKLSIELAGYTYRQQPPGGSGGFPGPHPPFPDQDAALLDEITRALDRLERYLTEEQKNRLNKVEQAHREETEGN